MSKKPPRPPFDVELQAALALLGNDLLSTITPDMLPELRTAQSSPPIEEVLHGRAVVHSELTIPGPTGAPDVIISVYKRDDHVDGGPGVFHIHGGGMMMGDRHKGIEVVLDWVELMDVVAVSVEYRLAPEHPDPAPVDDCYAALVWTAEHAEELGFDSRRLLIVGSSAGGGLAAGVSLMVRDRGGPSLVGQVLICPMLDDRNETVSSYQVDGEGVWDRRSNDMGWDALLGDRRRTDAVSIYSAPGRAADLSRLPPAFIDVGTVEVFRDENVAYASSIWAAGGDAELHVWPGGFHGFDLAAPQAALSVIARETRTRWVRRILGI